MTIKNAAHFGFASARAEVTVATDTEGGDDDPVVEVELTLIDGMFDVQLEQDEK